MVVSIFQEIASNGNRKDGAYSCSSNNRAGEPQKKPLLAAYSIPGLKEAANEDEKFKHDLAARADDIDVHSDAYNAVPIEQFGAAMLRGMGWKGSEKLNESGDKDAGIPKPRHHRLGLGATPKPPEEEATRKRPGEAPTRRELANAAVEAHWKKKASEMTSHGGRGLRVGDVVALPMGFRGSDGVQERGMVLRTQGGGLKEGCVKVRLELGGGEEEMEVAAGLIPIAEDELAHEPFSIARDAAEIRERRRTARELQSRRDISSKRERKSKRDRSRSRSRSRDRGETHKSKRKKDRREEKKGIAEYWLVNRIRVRIITKSLGSAFYTKKGTVVDVPCLGRATVRLDDESSGKLLENVKQKHLETVIPKRGGKVILLRGHHKGCTGQLMAKDLDRETAVVQLYEDMSVHSVSLDDCAEYTGLLDSHVED